MSHKKKTNPIDGAEMNWIPAGEFLMGSSDEDVSAILRQNPAWDARWFAREKPQRLVTLPGYWMYVYPVTVAQFRAYCEATNWRMPEEPAWGWQDNHPMVNVSWEEANQYAAWAQALLPNEAQWEKAARGADGRLWPWGNEFDLSRCANPSNSTSTQPVGSYPSGNSPYGIADLTGNVWEWCLAAPPGEYDQVAARNPQKRTAPASTINPVLRGGSWLCSFEAYLRCSYRCFECEQQRGRRTYRRPGCGFRCVVAE